MSDPASDSSAITAAKTRIEEHGWCETCECLSEECNCEKELTDEEFYGKL